MKLEPELIPKVGFKFLEEIYFSIEPEFDLK